MKFRNLRDMGLNNEDALLGVNACCQPVKHHFVDILLESIGIFQRGEGVDIHYAVNAIVFLLK